MRYTERNNAALLSIEMGTSTAAGTLPLSYYRCLYKMDGPKIIQAVQRTCGVSRPMLARVLGVPVRNLRRIERGREKLAATVWFRFCHVFLLQSDCFASGYSRRAHLAALADAMGSGEYCLPVSLKFYRKAMTAKIRHESASIALSDAILAVPYRGDVCDPAASPLLRMDSTLGFFRRIAGRSL
jgi:hypothetical protein